MTASCGCASPTTWCSSRSLCALPDAAQKLAITPDGSLLIVAAESSLRLVDLQ